MVMEDSVEEESPDSCVLGLEASPATTGISRTTDTGAAA